MLVNLRTIHRPQTLQEAVDLLSKPNIYPLYGGGASLIRADSQDVEEAVDVSGLAAGENTVDTDGDLYLYPASTLQDVCEQIAETDTAIGGGLSAIIQAEVPETLRNSLTLGDVFLEAQPNSLIMTIFSGLHTDINLFDGVSHSHAIMRMREWFITTLEQRRQMLLTSIKCRGYALSRYAYEKVSRTPSDAAIVGAVAFYDTENPGKSAMVYIGGLIDHPAHYLTGMQSTVSDYRGSAEYRTEIAKVLSERATAKVMALVKSK